VFTRGEIIRPYDLPKELAGFVIARLKCPVCEKDFTTTIRLDTFFDKSGEIYGSFRHYEADGGCGRSFNIIGTKYPHVIADLVASNSTKTEKTYAFPIGWYYEASYTDPEQIGWKKTE